MMRRFNAVLAMAALVMFVVHGVLGALNLMDIAPVVIKLISWLTFVIIALHAVISIGLSVSSIRTAIKTGAPYFRHNRLFWARRVSGVLILALVAFHMTAFDTATGGAFRLAPFDLSKLIFQLLFLGSIAVHIISNVKPALITFGVRRLRPKAGDILFFVSAAMLLMAAGFIIYFIRWQL